MLPRTWRQAGSRGRRIRASVGGSFQPGLNGVLSRVFKSKPEARSDNVVLSGAGVDPAVVLGSGDGGELQRERLRRGGSLRIDPTRSARRSFTGVEDALLRGSKVCKGRQATRYVEEDLTKRWCLLPRPPLLLQSRRSPRPPRSGRGPVQAPSLSAPCCRLILTPTPYSPALRQHARRGGRSRAPSSQSGRLFDRLRHPGNRRQLIPSPDLVQTLPRHIRLAFFQAAKLWSRCSEVARSRDPDRREEEPEE